MQAAIVLLADYGVQNYARRIVIELNQRSGVEFFASLMPAHVSLKQPFAFESLDALDRYTETLASQITPFKIQLDSLYADEWSGYGILGLNVTETPELRQLHNRLNRDLSQIVQDARAAFDGPDYRFHLTIEMGTLAGSNPFREYLERQQEQKVNLSFVARELAVFLYASEPHHAGSFVTYKVLPLTGQPSAPGMA
jgi:2'-5' RNA ligase